MQKRFATLLLFTALHCSCWGQPSNILSTVSPNLKSFFNRHPAAFKALSSAFSDALTNRITL